jgi:hypothetical protein
MVFVIEEAAKYPIFKREIEQCDEILTGKSVYG